MGCSACGAENRPGARFCNGCGSALAATCAACGQGNPPGSRFCDACGQPLTAPIRAVEPAPAPPQSYTPRHLAQKILAGREALQGERKQVTVLFADVVGSTELIRDRDPEDAQWLLDGVVRLMMDAVHRYEGTVSRLLGDGLMAMFGAPVAHEDHAVRACYAGIAMLDAVRAYAVEARRTHSAALQIRVGLNSGEVIVRLISDDLHMDYTAMGQTVHLASRMEGLATAGTALLSAATLGLVEGLIEARPLGPMAVKGLEQPIPVYELMGAGAARTRFQVAAARGLTPFVGRDDEWATLSRALSRARAGQGQVVALVGEPGVGKSRLVYEVTRAAAADGWTILETGATSHGASVPYQPIIDLLRSYARIEPGDDADTMRERLAGRVLALDRALDAILTPVLALLDGLRSDDEWASLDPAQRRRATLDAVQRLMLRESLDQPLLLAVEDLHWLDSESQALLDELVGSLPTARVLLLVTYRPEYAHAWGNKSVYTQLRIDPLISDRAEALLRSLLGAAATLAPLKRHLIEQTGGNPFFVEESVRSLVESGVLVGERGAYRPTRNVTEARIPATIQAVLAARIDRLLPEDKHALQSAAVVGKDVPLILLRSIAELPEEELFDGLARLQAAEFLYEASRLPEPEYTFKHALTQEVAYGSLLRERRHSLHTLIMVAIEHLYPDRLTEQVDRLAYHAIRGQVWEKAVIYLRQAGAKAAARSAHREAVAYFEQALAALPHLPETRETLEAAIDLRFDLRNSLFTLGDFQRMMAYLRDAESLARCLGDPRRLGQVSTYMSASLWATGRSIEALPFGQSAGAIAETLGDLALAVGANFYLGLAHHASGDCRVAEGFFRRVVHSLAGGLSRERCGLAGFPAVMARCYLSMVLAERGEFDEGMAHGQEGVRIAEALDHPYSLIMAWWGLGHLHGIKGELSPGIRSLERGLSLCHDWDVTLLSPLVSGYLGYLYTLAERTAEGLSLLQQALTAIEAMGLATRFHSLVTVHLGEACLLVDRPEDARAFADRAVTLTRQRGERGCEAYALRLFGEIAARNDPPDLDGAVARYRWALALAEELGMRPLQAHCHLGLGKLYRRVGRLDEARAELARAVAMLREMGMAFWLPEAEEGLAQVGARL